MADKEHEYIYDPKTGEVYLDYLSNLIEHNNNRNEAIENKLSAINRQSGLILTLSGLFIPLFYTRLSELVFFPRLIIGLLFISGFSLLAYSVLKSRSVFKINKFNFMTHGESTLRKGLSKHDLVKEMVEDSFTILKNNQQIVNNKGSLLIKCNSLFNYGIILISVISLILVFSSFFVDQTTSPTEVTITNPVKTIEIENELSRISKSIDALKFQIDSLNVEIEKKEKVLNIE